MTFSQCDYCIVTFINALDKECKVVTGNTGFFSIIIKLNMDGIVMIQGLLFPNMIMMAS